MKSATKHGLRFVGEPWAFLMTATFSLVALGGCGESNFPPRPQGLPKEAVYAGGMDGGDWVACRPPQGNVLYCRIFDPKNGALRYESWFRYCPDSGPRSAGQPSMLDARGLLVSDVLLRRDRPDVFHPPLGATSEEIQIEHEIIAKTYRDDGVRADCTRVQAP